MAELSEAKEEMIPSLSQKIAEICRRDETILAAYLFGSCARGCQRTDSDVDVAVLIDDRLLPSFSLLSFAVKVNSECDRQVDLVVLNRAGELLKREVRRSGIVVFDRAPARRRHFEIMGRKHYEDFLHLHRNYVRKALTES